MKKLKQIISVTMAAVFAVVAVAAPVSAASFSVSPMNERIILNPGEVYEGSFKVSNPASSEDDFSYIVEVKPFDVDENYNPVYDEESERNAIVDWTAIDDSDAEGTLSPNETIEIHYTITVPESAPAGGQYMSLTTSQVVSNENTGGVNITSVPAIAHIIYAEVAGTTIKSGVISDASVPSFIFTGNIAGTSAVENTGNTYGTATYTLQVFPLFSDEEVYTNVEDPDTMTIINGKTYYNETAWTDTPSVGIYNVVYSVDFEGTTAEVSKMVIVTPVWLLFIVVLAIIAIIILIVYGVKTRQKKSE